MEREILVRKASGEMEPFSADKLKGSLRRSGAEERVIEKIIDEIVNWINEINGSSEVLLTTRKIYNKAFSLLRKMTSGNAARYKLKTAMMELGPTGHPFEHFMGQIYKVLGYEQVEVAQVLMGHCVTHEVDVVATHRIGGNKIHQHIVECKYYQTPGKNANVQVPLYVHSRMQDIFSLRMESPKYADYTFTGGVATNTRFTSDAVAYGEYAGLKLLSWDYPQGAALRDIIDRERIFPITVLSNLTRAQKELLMDKGIVICRQLSDDPEILQRLSLPENRMRKLIDELEDLMRG